MAVQRPRWSRTALGFISLRVPTSTARFFRRLRSAVMRFPSRPPSQVPSSRTFHLIAPNFSLAVLVRRCAQKMPEPSYRAVRFGSYPPSAAHLGLWATFMPQTRPGLRMGKRSYTPKGTACSGPRLMGANREKSSALARMYLPSIHAGRRTGAVCGSACRPLTPLARHFGKWHRTERTSIHFLVGTTHLRSVVAVGPPTAGISFLLPVPTGWSHERLGDPGRGKSFRQDQPRTCAVDDRSYIHFHPGAKH